MLIVQVGCLVGKAVVLVGNVWLYLAGLEVPQRGPTLIKPCPNMRSPLHFLFFLFVTLISLPHIVCLVSPMCGRRKMLEMLLQCSGFTVVFFCWCCVIS